jgi:hypothetical protein
MPVPDRQYHKGQLWQYKSGHGGQWFKFKNPQANTKQGQHQHKPLYGAHIKDCRTAFRALLCRIASLYHTPAQQIGQDDTDHTAIGRRQRLQTTFAQKKTRYDESTDQHLQTDDLAGFDNQLLSRIIQLM